MRIDHIKDIIARACSLYERREYGVAPSSPQAGHHQDLFNRWCDTVARGSWTRFEKRLAFDGLTVDRIRPFIGEIHLTAEKNRPFWADMLCHIVAQIESWPLDCETAPDVRLFDTGHPVPFEDIFVPVIHLARQQLSAVYGDKETWLSEKAWIKLERHLLYRLSNLSARCLDRRFSVFLALRQASSFNRDETPSRRHYNAFVQDMLSGGWLAVFREYPVLARLISIAVLQWVDAIDEFLQRLDTDHKDIQAFFQDGKALGRIQDLIPGLSDFHNGGRSVFALLFDSGLKLIYKPKDLGLDTAFTSLLTWINSHDIPLPFYVPATLNRTTHGWMEYMEQQACKDRQDADQYYHRAGMLLCLLYILDTTDCHHENIIACGAHPILVDMETVLHPRVPPYKSSDMQDSAYRMAHKRMENSVLRVGLLPGQGSRLFEKGIDISGLGGIDEQVDTDYVLEWTHINTDRMAPKRIPGVMQPAANVPYLDETPLSPNAFLDKILEGFTAMYRWLAAHRDGLLATDGPLSVLSRQPVRFVFRATLIYQTLLNKLLHPDYLKDGMARSIHIDVLSRPHLSMADPVPRTWPILKAEITAMEQMDIPYFIARGDDDGLNVSPGARMTHYFEAPSAERVRSLIQSLDDDDLEYQLDLIRASFFTRTAPALHDAIRADVPDEIEDIQEFDNSELIGHARKIAEEIDKCAIRAPSGGASWIAPAYHLTVDQYRLHPIEFDLYNGCCGVGLFLAGYEQATGEADFHGLAVGAFEAVIETLGDETSLADFARYAGIGGASGIGSIIYALVRSGVFLNEDILIRAAGDAALLITPELVADDQQLDIIGGASGALLGLLSLYEHTHDADVLDRAILCGRHLLDHRVTSGNGFRVWKTIESHPLTGFSHGVAGIAYALFRLYKAAHDHEFLEAAEEGIAFEHRLFVPEVGNWPDLRDFGDDGNTPKFMVSWCNGAPGVGLGRLGGLPVYDTSVVRQEIEAAVKTTLEYGIENRDHVCCGNMGRLDLLVTAAQTLSRDELMKAGHKLVNRVIKRAIKNETYYLNGGVSRGALYDPGFFSGHAGIGYQLLRLACPDRLPSVLLWA